MNKADQKRLKTEVIKLLKRYYIGIGKIEGRPQSRFFKIVTEVDVHGNPIYGVGDLSVFVKWILGLPQFKWDRCRKCTSRVDRTDVRCAKCGAEVHDRFHRAWVSKTCCPEAGIPKGRSGFGGKRGGVRKRNLSNKISIGVEK